MLSAITEFPLSSSNSNPGGLTVGPDDSLWFPDGSRIGRIMPSGAVTEFPLPAAATPGSLTAGPDGNLWFPDRHSIGRITPSGAIAEFSIPTSSLYVATLTVGPDGNLWFGENGDIGATGRIGRITPSGAVTEFPLLTAGLVPDAMIVGSDGNLWFPESNPILIFHSTMEGKIGRITPSGIVTEFSLPFAGNGPGLLTVGTDGNIWFPNGEAGVVRMATSGAVTVFPVVTDGLPSLAINANTLTVGPDGNLWFGGGSSYVTDRWIGRITPSGAVTLLLLPGVVPSALTVGPDGNLWFLELYSDLIGRVTPSGIITEFAIPTAGAFAYTALTVGPDGNLWFPENITGAIGRIDPSALHGTGAVAVKHAGARITTIVLGFDEVLDPRTARERSSYSLAVGMLKKHFDFFSSASSWKGVKIAGVSYHRTKNTVRLKLARPHKGPLEVTVRVGFLATDGVPSLGDFTAVVP